MNTPNAYEIGGLAISAIVLAAAAFKIELFKSLAQKITSDKKGVNMYTILIIAVLVIVPPLLGYSIPEQQPKQEPTPEKEVERPKSKDEVIADKVIEGTKEAIVIAKEIADEVKAEKQAKAEDFEIKRQKRWVFKVGNWMQDNDDLYAFYERLPLKNNLALFKEGNKYFFFVDESHTQDELTSSISSYKAAMGQTNIEMVDLGSYTSVAKPNIVGIKQQTIGKKKNKKAIPCYSAHK